MSGRPPRTPSRPHARGSAALTQVRDARGRFLRTGRADDRPRVSSAGRTGPSHLARKTKLELVRLLTRLTLQLQARHAETKGERPSSIASSGPANMKSIRAAERLEIERRRAILAELLLEFAESRLDPRPCEIARRMALRLGTPFAAPQLYRPSLVDIWRPNADYFGRSDEDSLPVAAEHNRLSRRLLVHHILRAKRLLARVDEERNANLLIETADDEEWRPLVRPARLNIDETPDDRRGY